MRMRCTCEDEGVHVSRIFLNISTASFLVCLSRVIIIGSLMGSLEGREVVEGGVKGGEGLREGR